MRSAFLITFAAAIIAIAFGVRVNESGATAEAARTEQPNDGELAEKDSHGSDRVFMSDARIAAAGIRLERARPAALSDTLLLNGIIRVNQETLVQVTPRFPGIVRQIRKRIGDAVLKDEVMATIESNQSLTSVELKAPLKGTIIDRQISVGEYASEQKPAFTVADLTSVWVDLLVYVQNFGRVRIGDKVVIDLEDGGGPIEATISYVSPVGQAETQSALVRTVIPNPDGRLRPGLFVRGEVILTSREAPIAVKIDALQTMENKTVVFVREGDKLEARQVSVGERDKSYAEIIDGLGVGDVYAAENSFIVKAEIGKSDLDHE